jgi:hypothetical protein
MSRADLRYIPLSKELKDVVCWNMTPSKVERDIQIKILDRIINEYERDTEGGSGSTDGGDI